MKLLMIDDDKNLLNLYKLYEIGKKDIQIFVASNKEDAINLINTQSFDLIFLDYHLNLINGLDLTKELLITNPTLRIIILTGDITLTKEDGLNYGAIDVIYKPFSIEKIKSLS